MTSVGCALESAAMAGIAWLADAELRYASLQALPVWQDVDGRRCQALPRPAPASAATAPQAAAGAQAQESSARARALDPVHHIIHTLYAFLNRNRHILY